MPNRTFRDMTKLRVVFDNDPATAQELEVSADTVSNFVLKPQKTKTVSIQVIDTNEDHENNLSGIDNLSLIVERPEGFAENVRPMLNIGGLVEYPRGQGGVILDQYVIRQSEANPVNDEKKRTLISTLLRNIGADLGGAKTAVAGFNLQYTPLSLEGFANLYLTTQQGWSANGGDLSALPRGDNTFADVRYNIRDFTTSPLESAITLKHPKLKSNATSEEVVALPINSTVDTLFFLHTFLETRTWKSNWNNKEAPELFQYMVHYEDGTTHPIVITLNDGVANWLQGRDVTTTPKAEIAWSGPEVRGKSPTLYQFQWNNPFPTKKVLSIDLSYAEKGKDYGAPALLGITVARVVK
jgi:beta-galactosidase